MEKERVRDISEEIMSHVVKVMSKKFTSYPPSAI
jgi:hypothetical protein